MKKNKGLSDFIQKAMKTPDMIQRGKIHGSDSEIHSNLTRDEIIEVLNGSRESGSVRLTGTREERKKQLRELREKDLAEEKLKRGDSGIDTEITGSTSEERKSSLRSILDEQKKKKGT